MATSAALFDTIKAIEEEVVKLIAGGTTEALKSIQAGHVTRTSRSLTDYAQAGEFPYVEVTFVEDNWLWGTEKAEHTLTLEVAALVKATTQEDGLDRAKQLIGEIFDVLKAKPLLNCKAELMSPGRIELAPVAVGRESNWVYAAVASFNYLRRL